MAGDFGIRRYRGSCMGAWVLLALVSFPEVSLPHHEPKGHGHHQLQGFHRDHPWGLPFPSLHFLSSRPQNLQALSSGFLRRVRRQLLGGAGCCIGGWTVVGRVCVALSQINLHYLCLLILKIFQPLLDVNSSLSARNESPLRFVNIPYFSSW